MVIRVVNSGRVIATWRKNRKITVNKYSFSVILLPLTKPAIWLLRKILPNKKQKIKNELEIEFVESESKAVAIAKASEVLADQVK